MSADISTKIRELPIGLAKEHLFARPLSGEVEAHIPTIHFFQHIFLSFHVQSKLTNRSTAQKCCDIGDVDVNEMVPFSQS